MGAAAEDDMPLLCELGWHKPDPLARWNAGYYFTTCGRCSRDLVRTAYGGWRVPRGFKIVWQAKPPESFTAAELIPDNDQAPDNADQMELPIQEVLRQLEAEEQQAAEDPVGAAFEEDEADHEMAFLPPDEEPAADHPEPEPEPASEPEPATEPMAEPDPTPEPAPAPEARQREIDDFMADDWFLEEEPANDSWEEFARTPSEGSAPAAPPEPEPEPPASHADADIVDDASERVGNRSGKMRFGREVAPVAGASPTFLSRLRSYEREPGEEIEPEPDPQAEVRSSRRAVAATVAASFGVLMIVAAIGGRSAISPAEPAPPAPAPAQEAVAPETPTAEAARIAMSRPEETGFVTASLLNCRSAPAEQADPVRILPRGEPVRVLALEPAWASVSHRGRQCWASTRYLSAEQPL